MDTPNTSPYYLSLPLCLPTRTAPQAEDTGGERVTMRGVIRGGGQLWHWSQSERKGGREGGRWARKEGEDCDEVCLALQSENVLVPLSGCRYPHTTTAVSTRISSPRCGWQSLPITCGGLDIPSPVKERERETPQKKKKKQKRGKKRMTEQENERK